MPDVKTGQGCPTVLIPDEVTSEDAFRHSAVAHAMAEMILSNKEGGCGVALTGDWGSGKSTVVRFLVGELRKRDQGIQTFIFDAWAHQGDPLRRSFLEKLIAWCNSEIRWTAKNEEWNKTIEELARREETIDTTTSPLLTLPGAIGVLVILISPVAIALYQKIRFEYHPYADSLSLAVICFPFLFAAGILACWWRKEGKKPKKDRNPIPNFFYSQHENKIRSKSNKTPDPTSIEFEKLYCDLMSEVLEGNEKRVVIVVDNLDRINHDDARSIWATLRVFFERSQNNNSDWHKRVWVLVPFDPDALNDLWASSEAQGDEPVSNTKYFLEKTFQTTFRVPPIILSNWSNFLLKQLRTAFPLHKEAEFHSIFRLFDRFLPTSSTPPTPRNLKIFVNSIGALHLQWKDEIPLDQQAAFVLLADRNSKRVLETLQTAEPSLLGSAGILDLLLQKGWQRNLAALYFNVSTDQAYQALLGEPVARALRQGDAELIANLEKNIGFAEVLESIIESIFLHPPFDPGTLARAGKAFVGLKMSDSAYESCKRHLFSAARSIKIWDPFNEDVASGIKELAQMGPPGSDIAPFVSSLKDSLKFQNTTGMESNTQQWCEGILILLPSLTAHDENTVEKNFRIVGTPAQYFHVINETRKAGFPQQYWKYLRPVAAKIEIAKFLEQMAIEGRWDDTATQNLRLLTFVADDFGIGTVAHGLRDRIKDYPQPLPADVPEVLKCIFLMSSNYADMRNVLEDASRNDSLLQILSLSHQGQLHDAIAICILTLLDSDVQPPPPGNFQQNTQLWRSQNGKQLFQSWSQNPDSNLVERLASICLEWMPLGKWREISTNRPNRKPLIDAFLRKRLESLNATEIDATELVRNIDYWREVASPTEVEKLLRAKVNTGELASALIGKAFDPNQCDIYVIGLDKPTDAYKKYLLASLANLHDQDWLNAFSSQSGILKLASNLKPEGLKLGPAFQDALYAQASLPVAPDPSDQSTFSWKDMAELLDASNLSVFEHRLLSRFKTSTESIVGLIGRFGSTLTRLVIEDGPENSFDRVKKIIEDHNEQEISWLTDLIEQWKPQNRQAKDIRSDWKERTETVLEQDLPTENRAVLERLIAELKGAKGR
jgi:Cdc6-like AAA superfamily ATPase